MAAPDMTAARPGQENSSGDDRALFLKVFSGEVLTAFAENNVSLVRSMVRSIASGKSAQFPATWKAAASYHTPGTMITGQTINSNERVILIDALLISPVFIASIDEAMSQYEFRSEYSTQAGAALARTMDQHLLQTMALAARASATVSGGSGGTQITNSTALTDADSLVTSIASAAQALDEKFVPKGDRYVFLKPAQYYMLIDGASKLINIDYGNAGNGSTAEGAVRRIFGCEIVETNNLPQTNITDGTTYQGNFSTTAAIVTHKTAVGTVKLIDLATEMAYLIQNQGTLIVSKLACGHGILRPESAVEIITA